MLLPSPLPLADLEARTPEPPSLRSELADLAERLGAGSKVLIDALEAGFGAAAIRSIASDLADGARALEALADAMDEPVDAEPAPRPLRVVPDGYAYGAAPALTVAPGDLFMAREKAPFASERSVVRVVGVSHGGHVFELEVLDTKVTPPTVLSTSGARLDFLMEHYDRIAGMPEQAATNGAAAPSADKKKPGRPRKTAAAAPEATPPAEAPALQTWAEQAADRAALAAANAPAVAAPAAADTPPPTEPAPTAVARMTGPGRATAVPSPDAERVLAETGAAFRALKDKELEAARAAGAAPPPAVAPAPAAAPPIAAASAPVVSAPVVPAPVPAHDPLKIPPRPEDAQFPFKTGVFQGRTLASCSIRELETLVEQFALGVAADTDPEKRANRSLWLERAIAWRRHMTAALWSASAPADLEDRAREYRERAATAHPSQAIMLHRAAWVGEIERAVVLRKAASAPPPEPNPQLIAPPEQIDLDDLFGTPPAVG